MKTIFFKVLYLYFHGCEYFSDANTVSCCRKSQYFSFYRKNLLPTIQTERDKERYMHDSHKEKENNNKNTISRIQHSTTSVDFPHFVFLTKFDIENFFCEIYEAQTDVALLNMCCTDLLVE